MAGLCEGGNEPSGSLKAICKYKMQNVECEAYLDRETFPRRMVDRIIREAKAWLGIEEERRAEVCPDIEWPSNEEFTTDLGYSKLQEYISTWTRDDSWLHCINLVEWQMDAACDFYVYKVMWSMPTKTYPTPYAVASMFFTFEVSRIKPAYCPVEVKFVYEASRFVYQPGRANINEQRLYDIIDSKIKMFRNTEF
ncbi:hypothetical protein ANN_22993 [Periplaneta americana]|uniref:A-kinase anchor protein 14 n=1 Tax=Periplaneta americana TaxID=6978 RepID=A0ABQ8SKV0_PERAM|nr:hypothetical protein ANN_22993 [Periplaneta americana]